MERVRRLPYPPVMSNVEPNEEAQAIAAEIQRACQELPPGTAVEQLRNFCGRGWEMLHTPEFARVYRAMVNEIPASPDAGRFYAEQICRPIIAALTGIIGKGIARSEFRLEHPHFAARLILAALIQQAFWCNHAEGVGPELGCGCNRIVTDTLSIVLGGMVRE